MIKKTALLFLFVFFFLGVGFSQETKKDSLSTVYLDEVLVQYRQTIFGSKKKQVNTGASGYYLSPKELKLFDYFDVSQQLKQIPGVNIQQEDGFGLRPNISFRGVTPGRSSKITLMEDGILIAPAPYTSPAAYYFPTAGRMSAFEVLKGSSQIKYGPQTTAGVVNMVSTPIPTKHSAKVGISWGAYNTRTVHAFAGNTSRNFGYLIEAYNYGSDGFKELDFGEGKDTGFEKSDYMAKFMWKTAKGSKLPQSLLLKIQYATEKSDETYLGLSDKDFKNNPYRRYAGSQKDQMKTNHQVYALTHNIKPTHNVDITTTAYKTTFHRNWYKLGGIQNADGSNGAKISSILANTEANKDAYNMLTGTDTKGNEALKVKANNRKYEVKGVQTELNWNINKDKTKHHITWGARYHYDKIDRFQWEDKYIMKNRRMMLISTGKKGDAGNRIQESTAFATYIQYNFQLDRFTVTPGLRYEHIKQSRNEYGKNNPNRTNPKYRENTTKVFLPGVSAQYLFDNGLQIFAGVHKGFAPAGNTPKTKDENSYNYELGTRYSGNRLRTELVFFHSDYQNLLGSDLVATGGTGTGELFNAGKALAQGLECLVSYQLVKTNKLTVPVMLTYTYTDTELKNNFKSSVWGTVKSGYEIPYISKHQFGFIAFLQHNKYELSLGGKYQGEMRTKAGEGKITAQNKVGSFFTLDLSVKYHIQKYLTLRASATNLFNSKYEVARSPYGLRPGSPVMFNVGLNFNI